jgi:hypothetical protein
MCSSAPKVKPTTEKKPQYLRNPFLDGLALNATTSRNTLRNDLTPAAVASNANPGLVVPRNFQITPVARI